MAIRIRFDAYEIDLAAGQLYKRGARVLLRDQGFRVLAALVERAGEAVTREELRQRLWPDQVFVDVDNALNSAIARLREALGDSADHPRYIETLPKRGYRFIAAVSDIPALGEAAVARRPRVLVLPFVYLGGDTGLEYLGDAITDEMITQLAALAPQALAVIARTTAMRHKGYHNDVARIGRELGVDYVVEGAVRPAGGSVAVSAQLVRVSDQSNVWAKRYDTVQAEAFNVPASAAPAIADALGVAVPQRAPFARVGGTRGPFNLVAYDQYVRGRYHLDRMTGLAEGIELGRAHLEKALALDPDFAPAHEALAQAYWNLGYIGVMAPRESFAVGILHAVRALEIDNTRAESRALVAQFHKQLDYRWADIERELTSALELDPSSPLVRMLYAFTWLMPQGRIDEAVVELERTLELDPLSMNVRIWLAVMLVLGRQWDRAMEEARQAIAMEPADPFGRWIMSIAFRGKGLFDDAITAQQQAVDLSGGLPMMLGWLGLVLGSCGRNDEARAVLDRLQAMGATRYVVPTSVAWVHLGLGEVDRAFEWLDRAVDARDQLMMPIKTYAFFDPIRADPRFAALLRKMNLQA